MCGYLSQFESVQNKIRNGYLFKVCFCRVWGFFQAIPLNYFLVWCLRQFFSCNNSALQIYFGAGVKEKKSHVCK